MPTIDFDAPDMSEEQTENPTASVSIPSPTPHAPTEQDASFGEAAKDVLIRGVVGGAEQALRGTTETLRAGAKAVGIDTPELGDPLIEEPKAAPAQIIRDMTQFGLGFVGGLGLLRVTGAATKLAPVVKEITASGLGTGVVADPNASRLANLIERYPYLSNPVTEYLAADPTDGVAESKFKAALEDMLVTPAALLLFKTVKAIRSAVGGQSVEAQKLADEIVQDVRGANQTEDVLQTPEVKVTADAPPVKATPESATPETPAPSADDLLRLGRVTKGLEHAGRLKPEQLEKLKTEITNDPTDATFKLSLGKDGEVRAFRNAVVINDKAGKPLFSLTEDEFSLWQKHVNHMVSQNRLEEIFNFPEFSLFNARHSEANFETQEVLDALWSHVKPLVDKHMDSTRRLEETKKFADVLGENPQNLMGNIALAAKQADDFDKFIVAGKALLYDMAREARSLATRIHFETANPEEVRALEHLQTKMAELMGNVTSLRKGAARATSAGRINTGGEFNEKAIEKLVKTAQTGDVREFAKRLALAETDEAAIRLLKDKSLIGKLWDAHNEFWINGILSGVKTHVVNLVSTSMNTLIRPANQIIGGAILRDKEEIAEGLAIYRGFRTAAFDSLDMARRAFRVDRSIIDPGKGTNELIDKAITAERFNLDPNSALGVFVDYVGLVARIPGRFLKAEDEFFKQINARATLMAKAAREGAAMVRQGKLKETELERFIKERFDSGFGANGQILDATALKAARKGTFTEDLNAISTYDWFGNPGAKIQQFASGHPWLRGTILPFIKVPTNLMRAAGDFTPPIAMLKREGMDILTGKTVDPKLRAEFIGRLTTGSMLWTAAMLLAYEGRITGAAYGDKDMRDRQLETGWQPYSLRVNVGGKDRYISFQRNDPFGMFFGLAADFAYLTHHIDENSRHSLATAMALALSKNIAGKSYLQGLIEQAAMIGGGYTAEERVDAYFRNRVASYIPAYSTMFTGNDELKEVRSVMDALMAKLPGFSDQVPAKRDYFGEKRMAPMGAPWNAIDPYPVSTTKGDPVRDELARLSRSGSEARFTMPATKIGTIDLTQVKNAQGQTAYDRWTELLGTVTIGGLTFHEKLESVIASDRYQNGSDGVGVYHTGSRVVMIRDQQERYRAKALREMLKDFPDLRDQVRADKRNERSVKSGRATQLQDLLDLNQP